MLNNPGFESDPVSPSQTLPGWTAYGGNAYGLTSQSVARSGTNYFKVYQAFNGQLNYTGIYQDYISGPGATYVADGWAKTISSDALAGQNAAWLEVTFRDASANILSLYRSSAITTNALNNGVFPKNTWTYLSITNQFNPSTLALTNTTARLVAPAGTYFVRYQVVFLGDAAYSGGSVYFDDLAMNLTSSTPYGDWNIVWSDEFNGTNINSNTWTFDLGAGGWGNNELEYYSSRATNAYTGGGLLHIVARKEAIGGKSFSSARMKSQGLVSWKYGRFEWRARFPSGTGFWPALWLLGTNITNPSVGWPGCGEIDVMENSGAVLTNVQGSLHSGSDETAVFTFPDAGSVTNFHSYVLDWNTNAFLWYVDGHLYEQQTNWSSSLGAYPTPFNQPCFIIMNLAIGGNYLATNGVNPSVADINKSTFPVRCRWTMCGFTTLLRH